MDRADLPSPRVEALDAWIWGAPEGERPPRPLGLSGPDLAEVLRQLPDESLAVAIQKGFLLKEAFEELFVRRYTVYLGRWFYRWGSDPHLAQDLTQQLFLRFYQRRLESYQASDSFQAYLWKAAYHLWIQKVHRARRPLPLVGVPEPRARDAGPEGEAVGRETEARIEAALRRLAPEPQRVMRETMDGKKADEIAAGMGLSKRAVFMHLFRARRRLERDLSDKRRCQ
jgi:RNA polymerase sigma factor (sigma-70 family)